MKTVAVVLVLLAACERPRTEMLIGIATDLKAPDALSGVELRVMHAGVVVHGQSWESSNQRARDYNLPGSYALYSDGDEVRFELELVGFRGTTEVVTRTAVLNLIAEKTLFLRLGLTAGCTVEMDCAAGESCVEGQCRESAVDARRLPDYEPDLVDTVTCTSEGITYLDTATAMPMAVAPGSASCPRDRCHEGTCYNPPPGAPPGTDAGVGVDATPQLPDAAPADGPLGDIL